MHNRRALVTGITGQDGAYLAEFLLAKGYEVHGIMRRSSSFSTGRIEHVYDQLKLHFGDMTDSMSLLAILLEVQPDEVYNLAAQSHVRVSFDLPVYTGDCVALGTARLLEAIRDYQDRTGEAVRFYQASRSEMFGRVAETPQRETTPFRPRSPYACAKVYAHMLTVNYRESYGMHASCGILFNHESPRRGETFVTRKITRAAGRIKHGLQETVALGNLDAQRDWGFAGDYIEAMWLMLQQEQPDDYVIATGETRTVREFGIAAFEKIGMEFSDKAVYDPRYLRPAEVELLLGDATKARERLGWQAKTGFEELVSMMVDHDVELAQEGGSMLDLNQERVLVTGGTGFLGRHLCARLELGSGEVLGVGRNECQFSDGETFRNLLRGHRSTVVIHLAAVCGGIGANQARPAEMIHDNLMMACQVVRSAAESRTVKKLVLVGSVCSYPKFCPTPFQESDLWNGYPEETNAPYGVAKRALFELGAAYHRQYGLKVACLLPANLYGPGDSFDNSKSHVIPALIRKFIEAQYSGAASVSLWGTGSASRDFLFVEDCASAITRAAERLDAPDPLNIGTGREVRIREIAETIAEIIGYRGELAWDPTRPDGQPRRCLDVSRAKSLLNWEASTELAEGLRKTVDWYLATSREDELLQQQ